MRYTIRRYGDIDLAVHGCTYNERKNDVMEKAHTFKDLMDTTPISDEMRKLWNEYFREQGKQFGLLRIFKDMGII